MVYLNVLNIFFSRSLGLDDESGNIYEMLEYTFFDHSDLGVWENMMEGMVNVSINTEQGVPAIWAVKG